LEKANGVEDIDLRRMLLEDADPLIAECEEI
jgi:hypothetical protein